MTKKKEILNNHVDAHCWLKLGCYEGALEAMEVYHQYKLKSLTDTSIKRLKQLIENQNFKEVLDVADKLTAKFINKVETGRARSKETYADCKEFQQLLKKME